MVALTWLRGLLAHRRSRLLATAAGVAVGVALLASIGTFLSSTTSQMTDARRAAVPVDWQVEAQPGAARPRCSARSRHYPGVTRALPVALRARPPACSATTGGSTQQTGPGRVLGLPAGYAQAFPGELRTLAGTRQRRAARPADGGEPARRPGDTIAIGRAGRPAGDGARSTASSTCPAADSLFQQVGAPVGAQPQAPPDNVVLLPAATFARVEAAVAPTATVDAGARRRSHRRCPAARAPPTRRSPGGRATSRRSSPAPASSATTSARALDQARKDALYAAAAVPVPRRARRDPRRPGDGARSPSAGADRRRRDAALLRTRGASTRQLVRVALAETALAGGVGVALGLGARAGRSAHRVRHRQLRRRHARRRAVGRRRRARRAGRSPPAAIALPAWRDARSLTVAGQRRSVGRRDARAVVGALRPGLHRARGRRRSCSGRRRATATASCWPPRASPQVSVNWYALLAPVLGWIGAGLLAYRLADLVLVRGRTPLARLLRPLAGELSPTVAATMGRQRRLLAGAVTLVALTGRVRRLDRRVQRHLPAAGRGRRAAVQRRRRHRRPSRPASASGPRRAAQLATVAGRAQRRAAAAPLRLRRRRPPGPLRRAARRRSAPPGSCRTAWFSGRHGAGSSCAPSRARPDGVLVSAETVQGLPAAARATCSACGCRTAATKQFRTVPFHYVGVAKEFPTAPKDTFFVANAELRRPGHRQRRRRRVPGADRRHEPGDGRRAACARSVGTSAAGHRHRQPAPGGRLEPDRRRALGADPGRARLRPASWPPPRPGWRSGSASRSAAARSRSRARSAPGAGSSAASSGARRRSSPAAAWSSARRSRAGISAMLVKVLTGVFDPPPGRPRGALGLPRRRRSRWSSAPSRAAGALTLRALRRPAIEELRDL